jgi:hypothetical protein
MPCQACYNIAMSGPRNARRPLLHELSQESEHMSIIQYGKAGSDIPAGRAHQSVNVRGNNA